MNDKRYYYSEPLAAAWMGREFGVAYYTYPDGSDIESPTTFENEFRPSGIYFDEGIKYYIHPDSLPILEPQAGDYVRITGVTVPAVVESVDKETFTAKYHSGFGEINGEFTNWPAQIIQRKGLAFMWPKEELEESRKG